MRDNVVFLIVLLLGVFGLLVWLANSGSVVAAYVLGVVTTLVLYVVYSIFELLRNREQANKEQVTFVANAKENLAMMQAMQNIQNKQNQAIMGQIGMAARYQPPVPDDNSSTFLLEDGIFDELD